MNLAQWSAVDRYFADVMIPADPVMEAALAANSAAGLPAIHVAPNQAKPLQLLVRIHASRTVLEIGTLAGNSTIWLARALPPGGTVITLELDPKHAAVARENFKRAELANVIDLRLGAAIDMLPRLVGTL